ncbi:MAG: NAD(P)H-dependent oxidoreductase subunit E [Treponema sp.]|jgi:NADH:ubiquinone oxidoreductase subunit E|nr:NAD(P)H-dependent oxidoreductase subunit E [Treponema sp.]
MEKIDVSICTGTSCYVMGGSELLLLEEYLTPEQRALVELKGVTCLDLCRDAQYGKAPFVKINGQPMDRASTQSVLERINALLDREGASC